MDAFKSDKSRRAWAARPAWTAIELAYLCCGLAPDHVVDLPPAVQTRVTRVLENMILRAVQVKDPELPIIEDLRWQSDRTAFIYRTAPLFRPAAVWRWAHKHYPDTFPFTAEDFVVEPFGIPASLPERLQRLIEIAKTVPPNALQKEITDLIRQQIPNCDVRTAQSYAALIRPDPSIARDRRAKRRRPS